MSKHEQTPEVDKVEQLFHNLCFGPDTPRRSHPLATAAFWPLLATVTIYIILVLTGLTAGGCRTKATGGTATTTHLQQDSTGGYKAATTQQTELEIPTPEGPVRIKLGGGRFSSEMPDTRLREEKASTTQPSYDSTNKDFMAQLGEADAGDVASLITRQAKRSSLQPMVWPVAITFVALGALCWLMQKRLLAGGCLTLALLTFLFPVWVGIGMALVIALIAYSYRQQIKEIVEGQRNALAVVPAAEAVILKKEMERAHSPATKKAIQQGKMDAIK